MRINIKKTLSVLAMTFAVCLFASQGHADLISETLKGKELLFQRDYATAIALFEQIEKDHPDSPAGTFGQMAAWQVRMFENQDFNFRNEYSAVEKRFELTVYKVLENSPTSWDLFVAGSGYGMRGFYYARDGRWFRAIGSAVRAVQLLKRVAFNDPNFVDANLGLGMYNYWRSAMTKDYSFLPFFADKRDLGIEQIERVVKEGTYANDLSESNLAFIYTNEKEYAKSREILSKFLQKYPKNIILRQLSARSYLWTKKYDQALEEYKQVLKVDPSITKTLYHLGVVSMRKPNGTVAAKKYFEQFLATNPEKEWVTATKEQLKKME